MMVPGCESYPLGDGVGCCDEKNYGLFWRQHFWVLVLGILLAALTIRVLFSRDLAASWGCEDPLCMEVLYKWCSTVPM